MTLAIILDFVNLFCAGMLAGIEFVIHYGLTVPAAKLDDRSQLRLRQALILRLRVLVPAFFVPTAVSGSAVTVLAGGAPGLWFRAVALLAIFVWVLIRIVGTVRINSATLEWPLDTPPPDWQAQVTRAERFHTVGVWSVVLTFACFLTAVALKLTTS